MKRNFLRIYLRIWNQPIFQSEAFHLFSGRVIEATQESIIPHEEKIQVLPNVTINGNSLFKNLKWIEEIAPHRL